MSHISHRGFGTLLSFCVSFSYKCGMKTKVVNQSDFSLDLGLLSPSKNGIPFQNGAPHTPPNWAMSSYLVKQNDATNIRNTVLFSVSFRTTAISH